MKSNGKIQFKIVQIREITTSLQKNKSRNNRGTYWTLNGLAKNINEMMIVTAFRAVVTVAANGAPHVRTNVSTNWMPR